MKEWFRAVENCVRNGTFQEEFRPSSGLLSKLNRATILKRCLFVTLRALTRKPVTKEEEEIVENAKISSISGW